MKASIKMSLVVSAISLSSTSAFAYPVNFIGVWKNLNPNSNGIVKVVITPGLTFRAFGSCTPVLCDHGPTPLVTYGKTISDSNHRAGTAQYHFSFKDVIMTIKLIGTQRLNLEHYNKFTDASGRQNYWKAEQFKRVLPIESDNIMGDINEEIDNEIITLVNSNGEKSLSLDDTAKN